MNRLDALTAKIIAALRDRSSGMAAFDMLPAWQDEYFEVHGDDPGTAGGAIAIDHFMHTLSLSDFDEHTHDGVGTGIARLGRCMYRFFDNGRYMATIMPSTAEAKRTFKSESELFDLV